MGRRDVNGVVYLIHFQRPYKHARHYIGWASNMGDRLFQHRGGRGRGGGRLTEVLNEAGIEYFIARAWHGTRSDERALKNLRRAPHLCPFCTPAPAMIPQLREYLNVGDRYGE